MNFKIKKWINLASIVLLVFFIIKTIFDYTQYSSTLNSAPFSVWIFMNIFYFILPAIILSVIAKKIS